MTFVAFCTVMTLFPSAIAGGPATDPCASVAIVAKARLTELLHNRGPNGSLVFAGPNEIFARYPLFTTVGLHLYQSDRDVEFLRTLHASATAHLNYTLARADTDGDFLLERTAYQTGDRRPLEDAAFNAMFAMDMASLAALCVELRLPVDALYWYQGMRTISQQLVRQAYDADSGTFHSYDNATAQRDPSIQPLSTLPTFFRVAMGDNVADAITREYVLRGRGAPGPTPYDVVTSAPEFAETEAVRRLAALALLSTIDANGFNDEALAFSGRVRPEPTDDYAAYFECMLSQGQYKTFLPRTIELRILDGIAGRSGLLQRESLAQNAAAINKLENYLIERRRAGFLTAHEADELEQSMRHVYMTISEMRKWWRQHELFSPADRRRIPGFDANAAFDLVATRALTILHEVENDVSRSRTLATGFDIRVTPASPRIAPNEPILFNIELSSIVSPVGVKSVAVSYDQKRESIQEAPNAVFVRPGVGVHYDFLYTPRSSRLSTLLPIQLTVEVTLADSRRLRYHFNDGVFVAPPVTFELAFPQGDVARRSSLPVALQVEKNAAKPIRVRAEWYSPSGLTLKEGHSLEITVPAENDRIEVPLTIALPANARPGAFPFVLKMFEGTQERGTIRSSLFKHYNWLFLGPLRDNGGLAGEHPPERGVNLVASYRGANGNVNWSTLPERMYESGGRVNLNDALPEHTIGYLYTVLKSEWDLQTSITLASQSPAMLIVNGDAVLTIDEHEAGTFKRTAVILQQGANNILVKVAARDERNVFLQLGDESDLAADEFNNNMVEFVDGYKEFLQRTRDQFAASDASQLVTLTYRNPNANSVAVIGSFNGWSPVDTSMRKLQKGVWEISLHLPPGRYAYRLLIDNAEQILDPANSIQEPDGYGGVNSILFVR